MIYISTDYVFDGKLGRAYTEIDQTNPLSIYGKSKYAGEVLACQATDRLFVLRTAWLYGDGPTLCPDDAEAGSGARLFCKW